MRPKAKFLTVVWGETYIERFAALALPSLLAPGNLPALAAGTDLEVVILTKRSDFETFDKHPAFRALRAVCTTRFIQIDDLITTAGYGFTLTLAYARAVIDCGPEMLKTHFVFMNADFVLADGSLQTLLRHIVAGRSIVLAPSFRATAEAIEPKLEAAVDTASQTLVIPPRQLTALALAHPHPTTVAKILNQGLCHSVQPNQFFWRVDQETVLGRYYLIFMLCLRPERIIRTINSYCDYSFIPEMCPSGDEAVMADSDDFFMLELQRRHQEAQLLRPGPMSNKEAARSLTQWTTEEHRRAAKYDIVFHGGDLPSELDEAKARANAFVRRMETLLGPTMSHVGHPHWIGGVDTFRELRVEQGLSPVPPELDITKAALHGRHLRQRVLHRAGALLRSAMLAMQRSTLGRIPLVTALHPSWLDYVHLRRALESLMPAPGARILVVREHPRYVDMLIGQYEGVRLATPSEVLEGLPDERDGYAGVLIYLVSKGAEDLMRKDLRLTRRLVKRCQELVHNRRNGCHVFIHQVLAKVEDDAFAYEMVRYLDNIVQWPLRASVRSFVGGWGKRLNSALFNRLGGHYAQFGPFSLLWVIPLLIAGAPVTLLTNLWSLRRPTIPHYIQRWSSALVTVDGGKEDTLLNETVASDGPPASVNQPALATPRRSTT